MKIVCNTKMLHSCNNSTNFHMNASCVPRFANRYPEKPIDADGVCMGATVMPNEDGIRTGFALDIAIPVLTRYSRADSRNSCIIHC